MKKIILLLMLSGAFALLKSQEISYIIPDIGSPGMNTYMEIIGPHDQTGNFGEDAMYINGEDVDGNSTDEVEFVIVNSDDEDKIVFGPAIVSWDGRMISTQVFVNPYLNPNTSDWENLNDEFKVEFYVSVNGSTPAENQTFYILQPTPLGDISGSTETVFGEGSLGKRSPAGAMLVDSLILADDTKYTVSVNDPDPSKDGNQAYLPFVLLSKGAVRGGNNTEISLSADDYGNDRDAAPGGGGGGGRFCDEVSGNNGSDGGNGFTGGGEGGWNRYLEGGNIGGWKDPGIGTGSTDGISLNGVAGGVTPVGSAAESSGGGTGHPFGTSGEGATFNTDEGRIGGYGAGSGRQRDWAGGGAGYGTDGDDIGLDNHGKAHGNTMTVPLAGGSGGASGNPEAALVPSTYCSGSGGGGGGAIQIYAPKIENLALTAIGGLGGGGYDGSNGGSGSGGFVGVYSKTPLNNVNLDVSGNLRGGFAGKNGKSGEGRVRYDLFNPADINLEESFNSQFEGFTSDTSFYVKRNHTIQGTKDPNETISYYLKSLNTDWQKLATNSASANQWNQSLDLQDEDMYFFFAVQHSQTPNNGTYDDEPDYVLSQAAANVLLIEKDPDINGVTTVYDTIKNCEGLSIDVPFYVWNEGEGPLELNMQSALFHYSNQRGFSLRSPTSNQTLGGTPIGNTDYDSLEIVARVRYFPGTYDQPVSGTIRDTLVIPNNDPDEDPWRVAFEIFIEEYNVSSHLIAEDPMFQNPIDSLYLGKVCRGGSASIDFIVYNRSPFTVDFNEAKMVRDTVGFEAILNFSMPLDSDDGSGATVYYDDISTNEDFIWDMIYLSPIDCPGKVIDSVYVWIDIVDTDIHATAPTTFEDTRVGNTSSESVVFENTGTADLLLESLADITVNPPFYVTGATPNPPVVIKPGEQITVDVDFSPTDTIPNPKIQFLNIEFAASDSTCPDDVSHEMQGLAIQSELEINKMVLDFGTIRHCETVFDTVMISNSGNIGIEIPEKPLIIGADEENFVIASSEKEYPLLIDEGGVKYFIQYVPQNFGTHNAELIIKTDDDENLEIRIRLTGTMEPFNVTATQSPFDFGDVYVGFDTPFTISLENNGFFEEFFVELLNPSGPDYVTVNTSENTLLPSGGNLNINGTLNLQQAGNFTETLIAAFEYPVDDGGICYDTVYINIRANGLTASLEITDAIDFGTVTPCYTAALDIIEFAHGPSSKAPYIVLNEELINNDSGLFSISSSGLNLPDTLDTEANEFGAQIYFDPAGAADGVYTCNYRAEYYINGQFKDTLISIKAEVVSAKFDLADNPLDMGSVILGTPPAQDNFTLTNTGVWDIRVVAVSPIANTGIFTINPAIVGTALAPGESRVFDVTFAPAENIEYTEQLTIEFEYFDAGNTDICVTIGTMNIRGEGGVTKEVELSIPDLYTTPDLDDFRIPVYAKLINNGDPDPLEGFNIDTIEISYNRTLFYPREVTRGEILATFVDNDTRVIQISVPDISITDSTVITEIIGYTMLGNSDYTPLDIIYASHSQPNLVSDLRYLDGSGSLTIEICREGGDRLLQVLSPEQPLVANPNPAGDNITISMNLIEKGQHRLELIDINGKSMPIDSWMQINAGYFEMDYNTSELSSGMYYLILKAPNRSYSLPVFIVK
jgi:hypothetical protein